MILLPWAIKNAVYIISGIVILAVGWWLINTVIIAPMNAKHDAVAAHADTAINAGGTKSAQDAVNIAYQNGVKAGLTDAKTRTQVIYLNKQPGANDPVNPAYWDAFLKSECMYLSTASDPQCNGLRQSGP